MTAAAITLEFLDQRLHEAPLSAVFQPLSEVHLWLVAAHLTPEDALKYRTELSPDED